MPKFSGMPTHHADAFREGGLDAYGNPPERQISDGSAPCRCCLKMIPEGAPMLILAYRPFDAIHAYAETGPVFICADHCAPDGTALPKVIVSPDYLLKAHSADERVIYGTGQITPRDAVESYAATLLARDDVAFVDLRSARNNCWQVRITRD
ncbi:DUF1203 domain-containing protein [Yoonia sp. F2084L]|uniref:DUF1203 domain-containing protein n=1 Tax=Yoonia sp. F2084L TaxID=2926419 RepID=UPI001FF184DC|nr:DUF1203 domain-containing protein [Yoonia sp. F2084L]MCK0096127.1 DUF1203 domain-containing protein [Yoonia sp. F2084L]